MRVLVLHGPNLNLLGSREPAIYGTTTLPEIDRSLASLGASLGASVECRQSNHEGVLLDWVHQAAESFDGLLVNFGALSHSSLALADALRAVPLPCVEVHLSNIHGREPFRQLTHTGAAALGLVSGFGPDSYLLGLRGLVDHLGRQR